ncbi:MAG: SGNH/GDSL hydrolase family protein, partial [Bacteroidota bacterium]
MAVKKTTAIDPKKRKIFLTVTVLFPFLLLTLLEISLRLFNYGPDLSLFHKETINGTEYYSLNPDVGRRYFHQVDFTPDVSPDIFTVSKPSRTYRIFCLGASTTAGYPYWYNASFSLFLRDRLQAMFPAKHLEVINLGLTATNSFTVLDIARELPQYKPDLFIVYDGHNEFYGAFGAGSRESLGASRLTANFYLRMIHLRTFLLVRNMFSSIVGLFSSSDMPQERGTTMERLARGQYIPYNSDTYASALETFRENLHDLKEISTDNHIPMILVSQVSNLRDLPPFISGELPGSDEQKMQYRRKFDRGTSLLNERKIDSALAVFQQLLSYDSLRADVHFSIARCLDLSGKKAEANTEYIKARDYDQLRFRTNSEFNSALRNTCDTASVFFLDMEQVFKGSSPDSLIGTQLIFEHLHPNARGYSLMAKAMARTMQDRSLFASAVEWNSIPPVNEDSLWQVRKVSTF